MAQYKVPQDVEADDKLLGPFSFRQFVYLMIAGGLIAVAVGLFQLFPLLAIIPLPPVLLFGALALPLKKDQPMETYLAAVVSYYLKPHTRRWTPGQKGETIEIMAPKVVDDNRTRNLTSEEATHRLSFLANIVDTEGYAIKGMMPANHVNEDLVTEAAKTPDMFEASSANLTHAISQDNVDRHNDAINRMREEIKKVEDEKMMGGIELDSPAMTKPEITGVGVVENPVEKVVKNSMEEKGETKPTNPSIMELANNSDYSVATIAKEANRIKERDGEVFISLH